MNTDIVAVFKLLLDMAIKNKLNNEQMIKKIFIFTDMQFDQCSCQKSTETIFDHVRGLYKKKGFTLPHLVFWNLRASMDAFPVEYSNTECTMVSGFSAELLKLFLEDGNINTEILLDKVLNKYTIELVDSEI